MLEISAISDPTCACWCVAQVGAAFAVLQAGGEQGTPLELQAAKSRLLHTEPAAGAVGLAAAAGRLQGMPGGQAMLHLRHVNPHVSAIFQVPSSFFRTALRQRA